MSFLYFTIHFYYMYFFLLLIIIHCIIHHQKMFLLAHNKLLMVNFIDLKNELFMKKVITINYYLFIVIIMLTYIIIFSI